MRRSWHIWVLFTLCLAVVLAAMGWISLKALSLVRAAALEQNVGDALWRMDYALTPLVGQESARPYFAFHTFLPVDRAYRQMFNDRVGPERLVPSPLLGDVSLFVLVHFQFEPDGRLTSPRVPPDSNVDLAVPDYVAQEAVREAEAQLARVAALVDREQLLAMLPDNAPQPLPVVIPPLAEINEQRMAQAQFNAEANQYGQGFADYSRRRQGVANSANVFVENQKANTLVGMAVPSTDLGGVLMTPLWVEGNLLLARRISAGGQEYVQGCLLDWPAIKESLLLAVEDLLPDADLEPVTEPPAEGKSRLLAALPVRLIPGERIGDGTVAGQAALGQASLDPSAAETDGALSPIQFSLLVAWGCVLLAAVAVAALLSGVIRLSERRAAFVSAVTHELRTPLTTFHMYTEMLAEGMVPDQQQQQSYLSTLRSEASRLSHLVENVLSYARLERGRTDGRMESVSLDQLVHPIEGRLVDRARQDGMQLVVEGDEAAFSAVVRANRSAVEQILLNLVDNAAKYAGAASDKRIHLSVERTDGAVRLRVRDHGPGIARPAGRRLFRPFSKSAREAANSAPGVGLGLALSRRLAGDMGGRLWLDKTVTDGACFVLTLSASDKKGY